MPRRRLFLFLFTAALATSGCGAKHVVRAAPPSVSTPPPVEAAPMPQPTPPPQVENQQEEEPPPEAPLPATAPLPPKRPAPRPRPPQSDSAEAPPKPAPPQISPQLSARDLATAKSNTTSNMSTADRNMQLSIGRQLNAAQKDLVEKINGFLGQAREAIAADDWVRAQNLAEKAQVLSGELVKSF